MKTILELLLTLTIGGSAVVLCLQALKLFYRDGTKKWLYRIGKIGIGLYLLPIAVLAQWIFSKYGSTSENIVLMSGSDLISDVTTHALQYSVSIKTVGLLFSIWILGVIVFASWQIYCYVRFTKVLQLSHEELLENSQVKRQFNQLKRKLKIKGNVKLRYSEAIRSPFLIGLWNPTIYLPKFQYGNPDIEIILHHELIHLKRKDVWVKTLALMASVIHWFNPFIYLLRKDIHKWSELTCDEEVVKYMSKDERKYYGKTIINVMIGRKELPLQFCSSLSSEGKQLKRRLKNMLHVKKVKKSTVLFSAIATILIALIGTSTAVWATDKTPEIDYEMDDIVVQEKYNEEDQAVEKAVEVEFLPESDATEEQIEAYQHSFDASDANEDFWADVEEDVVYSNKDINETIINEVELEAGIFVDVE